MDQPRKKLLILEDNEDTLKYVIRELRKVYEVSVALDLTSACEAVLQAKKHGQLFDGYIIDVGLPVADAPEELREFIAKLQPSPISPQNAGQAWARWLRTQHKDAKYFYLTALKEYFVRANEPESDASTVEVLQKFEDKTSPANIVGTVTQIFSPW